MQGIGAMECFLVIFTLLGNISTQSQYNEKSQSISGTTRQPQGKFGKLSW